MRVDGVNKETIQGASPIQAMDSVSKNLRAQIANAQKQLQELAANKEMEPEEKMERRKEIQQRITELNAQLRQHEIELRHEKQRQTGETAQSEQARRQEAKQRAENAPGGRLNTGLAQGSMEAMVSADRAIGQAKVQGNVAVAMRGRANVLKSEIEHSVRGAAVEKKQERVADIEARLEELAKEQAQSLNQAGRQIDEAEKDAREERKAEAKKQEKDGSVTHTEKTGETEKREKTVGGALNTREIDRVGEKEDKIEEEKEKNRENTQDKNVQVQMPAYRKVDILL